MTNIFNLHNDRLRIDYQNWNCHVISCNSEITCPCYMKIFHVTMISCGSRLKLRCAGNNRNTRWRWLSTHRTKNKEHHLKGPHSSLPLGTVCKTVELLEQFVTAIWCRTKWTNTSYYSV